MKLEIIPYLSIHHILGTASVPQGFTIAAKYPVRDETGRSGVLIQNKNTGLYALYVGGVGHCLYSVEHSAAKKFVKAHQNEEGVEMIAPTFFRQVHAPLK